MDDIDDLFADPLNDELNDGLPDDLSAGLNGNLVDSLNAGLDGGLDATLTEHINGQLQDPLNDQLAISHAAPPPGLAARLDKLHMGGCNQTMAWSRLGALACIDDSKSVKIRCLQFQRDGTWGLSDYTDPTLMDKLSIIHQDFDCVHVIWSPIGGDLVIVDSSGRIAVGFMRFALNRIMISKVLNHDFDGNLNTVVAIKWLNQIKKPIAIAGTAIKTGGHWKYPLSGAEPRGPFSPNHKAGFLIVTRGLFLKLYLQGAGAGDWMEVKVELDRISTSYELISHATMCAEKSQSKKDDDILLAVHTTAGRLRLYTIRIDWQTSQDPSHVTASLRVQHVTQLDRCLPLFDQSVLSGMPAEEHHLCFLTLIPRAPLLPGHNNTTSPIILAAFSHMDSSGSIVTTISRWEVDESRASIDSTFNQLSTKKASSGHLVDERALKPLEEIHLDQLVIGVELIEHDAQVVLHYSNGDTEFRDRNMGELPMEETNDRASSFNRVGFAFDRSEPCLEVALSPHSTVKVSMSKGSEYKLSSMHRYLPIVDQEAISQVTAVFVLQHVASEGGSSSLTDDLLMTMWEFERQLAEDQRKKMEYQFMKDLYQLLQITEKCTDSNIDAYIKLPALGKTASMQASLNVRIVEGSGMQWTRPGKIALTIQNLRIIAVSLSCACANIQKGQEIDLHRPEVLDYLVPQLRWFIQLVDYILDQLFQVNRVMGVPNSFDSETVAVKVESAYACLIMVMCTIPRTYLRYIIRAIKTLPSILQPGMSQGQSSLSVRYNALSAALRGGITQPKQLDMVLEMTERILNPFYARLHPRERQDLEMQLLADGTIPTGLNPFIQKLLSQPIEQLRTQASEVEELLAFRQWGPVSLVDDKQTLQWQTETTWDASRKVDLTGKKVRTRTCLRCTNITEDVTPKDRAPRTWLTNMMRTCFCGGQLILDKPLQEL